MSRETLQHEPGSLEVVRVSLLKFFEEKILTLTRGTSALHLNEATWIIDGSNELIVDFLFVLALFLDSTQPWPFKNPKQIFFFWIKQTNDM